MQTQDTIRPVESSTRNGAASLRLLPSPPHLKLTSPSLQKFLDPLPRVDANRILVRHPGPTFYVSACGDSMTGAGINEGDLLVIDGTFPVQDGDVIAAHVDGECVIKRLKTSDHITILAPDNPDFEEITVTDETHFEVMGKVMWILRPVAAESREACESSTTDPGERSAGDGQN